jgi:hypothetical protein
VNTSNRAPGYAGGCPNELPPPRSASVSNALLDLFKPDRDHGTDDKQDYADKKQAQRKITATGT